MNTRRLICTPDDVESRVERHPLLAGIDTALLPIYQHCATLRRFASRQHVFLEGSTADHFYLILTGSVAVETFVPGRGNVTIQSIGPGEALGWSWLFPPHQWLFTARTEMPTEVISLEAEALRSAAGRDLAFESDLFVRLTKTLVQRLQATRLQLTACTAARRTQAPEKAHGAAASRVPGSKIPN